MGELVERVDDRDEVLAVVGRSEAIRQRWLHRIATIVCRDARGRTLVHRRPAFVFKFRCTGAISPYWLGLHEAVVDGLLTPDPAEIAWYDWLAGDELAALVKHEAFVPDAREAFERYVALQPRP
ncbi:NTP pyrophosphohydrolase [Streptomyces kunmingensis]|uniref:NTP pyrophosphohydrolase n=1 Tax=Streptomyces kunmingensis TaxID=68225 RepID=A0ABU6CI51_9ACTN|nr:NTP pyrophosphohydrolase [Streptomyces kunmingensis]MEB3964405.1 NTP pyrophosphohydrolase [Streptomyces kunmingensis]